MKDHFREFILDSKPMAGFANTTNSGTGMVATSTVAKSKSGYKLYAACAATALVAGVAAWKASKWHSAYQSATQE